MLEQLVGAEVSRPTNEVEGERVDAVVRYNTRCYRNEILNSYCPRNSLNLEHHISLHLRVDLQIPPHPTQHRRQLIQIPLNRAYAF